MLAGFCNEQISVKRLRQHLVLCKPQRFFEETVGAIALNGDSMLFYEIYGDSHVRDSIVELSPESA